MGYASRRRWVSGVDESIRIDELSLNPEYFMSGNPIEVLQTLVHEMVHIWQYHHGKVSRAGYHNKQWSETMKRIGLMPSTTGRPGGKPIGQNMSDYVISGGAFETAVIELFDRGFEIPFYDRKSIRANIKPAAPIIATLEGVTVQSPLLKISSQAVAKRPLPAADHDTPPQAVDYSKRKYICDGCRASVWGKTGLRLGCMSCNVAMKEL